MTTPAGPYPPHSQPQWGPGPQQPQYRNGLGTTGFVLGLLAALFAWIPFIGVIAWPLAILGVIFSVLGLYRAIKGRANNKGLSIAGLVLSVIALVFCVVYASAFASAASDVAATGSVSGSSQPAASGDAIAPAGTMIDVGGLQLIAGQLTDKTQYGNPSLCTTVSYNNTGAGSESYNSYDWQLLDPNGATTAPNIAWDNALNSGSLVAGGTTSGDVCFATKATAGEYRVLYSPFGGTKASWTSAVN
ncbi:DUF4190 domain-containing protein [Pseudonocardia parietis]|uniref:DUF4352 domain-containing protein n=1 Tax=Pseudonocardia parietis TaxID=570936 RepID=A0ABS4VR86_9PSEU|nr:DUF4190 domain-containing protein [Pseudonocardia parietis]MBP2366427.1 hypothetical protein [Pseudonocardia parietis]